MISIILPAYKATYLREAIDSILAQSYKDFELIIVNDASSENLATIVNSFDDKRIRYYENHENIGRYNLVKNWNLCMNYAQAHQYLVLASDDDVYHPSFLQKMIELAEKYPNVNLFHCRVSVMDKFGKPIFWAPSIAEYETDIDFIYQRAITRRTQLVSDFMVRAPALHALGGFVNYPKAWYSDDMTWFLLSFGKGVVCSMETLFYWRLSNVNISSAINDTMQKAEASFLHLRDMKELIKKLIALSEKDEFLLRQLKSRIQDAIVSQLIQDMGKSSMWLNYRILKKTQFRTMFAKKHYIKLFLCKLRCLFRI